jgi:hypothetical protein
MKWTFAKNLWLKSLTMGVTKSDFFGLPLNFLTGADNGFRFGVAFATDVAVFIHVSLDSSAAVCMGKWFFGLSHDLPSLWGNAQIACPTITLHSLKGFKIPVSLASPINWLNRRIITHRSQIEELVVVQADRKSLSLLRAG